MVAIVFGTESGNSEMVAEDLCEALEQSGVQVEVLPMDGCDVQALRDQDMVVLVCSTYGEGELPATAIPLADGLTAERPDLSPLKFAAFGLGDSTYDTYNRGIARLAELFTGLGAVQVGEIGQHDADSGADASKTAVSWAAEIFAARPA
jgi:MioC protein